MQRYSLFGRLCRDACVQLFKVLHYLQEQEGNLEVEARKVAWGAIWQCSTGNFFELFEEIPEHGILHGITNWQ
jgi:hypothetical protein